MQAHSGAFSVLVVGNAVLDIILNVDHFPAEDEEMRATSRRIAAGGNAANTAQVLAGLGHRVSLLATLAADAEAETLRRQLVTAGVDCDRLVRCSHGYTPLSYILLNAARGTRTIVHHRELGELKLKDFQSLPLSAYDWIHFEGRNVAETGMMLRHARQTGYAGRLSLEIEKERPGLDALFPLADLLLFSRTYVESRGYTDAVDFLGALSGQLPGVAMTCTWGEAGAWARDAHGCTHHAPAYVPPRVFDSLGAGDVFNAGMIHALLAGRDIATALTVASRLAGQKVGLQGLRGLTDPLSGPAAA